MNETLEDKILDVLAGLDGMASTGLLLAHDFGALAPGEDSILRALDVLQDQDAIRYDEQNEVWRIVEEMSRVTAEFTRMSDRLQRFGVLAGRLVGAPGQVMLSLEEAKRLVELAERAVDVPVMKDDRNWWRQWAQRFAAQLESGTLQERREALTVYYREKAARPFVS